MSNFVYHRTVRLADTDAAGVVYFANILTFCHEAYEEMLAASGIELRSGVEEGRAILPIFGSTLDCLGPLGWGDRLLVRVEVLQLRSRSFELGYEIVGESAPETVLATATTRHVCLEPRHRQKRVLPEAIARSLHSLDR
ncbi:MAG: thioesterase family protein [Cyanobacteriota bacterium]|nr:thioesterase family protein [Cyanobacteriota bacterium]